MPFAGDGLWAPYKERMQIDAITLTAKDYFILKISPNFTIPADEFFVKYEKHLPFNTTSKQFYQQWLAIGLQKIYI